ncbi:oxidoreductase [Virgibacillus siamensis]|uniref:oxidoreductase n=1 Tax=Virgibacillus siamensis TaxID=480071 RepID=UPI0009866306|nr:oxidoreductase [Virgibacillus siamensis]
MNPPKKNQPIAFITGASGGFGLLTSIALAKAGYFVVASMRNLAKKEKLVELAQVKEVETSIKCIQLDVTKQDEIEDVMSEVINLYGRIDVLINNAGYAAGGYTEEVSLKAWRQQFETNFFGLVAVTKEVLPHMRKRLKGTIINLSSISGRMALPGLGPYSASKHAVEGFSESLRLEMLPYGVHVVLIEPGSYQTDIWAKGMGDFTADPSSPYKDKNERLLKIVNHIAKTAGDPEEVIRMIARVAQDDHPDLRYPVGKGVKNQIRFKNLLPWRWLERVILKKL